MLYTLPDSVSAVQWQCSLLLQKHCLDADLTSSRATYFTMTITVTNELPYAGRVGRGMQRKLGSHARASKVKRACYGLVSRACPCAS